MGPSCLESRDWVASTNPSDSLQLGTDSSEPRFCSSGCDPMYVQIGEDPKASFDREKKSKNRKDGLSKNKEPRDGKEESHTMARTNTLYGHVGSKVLYKYTS